MKLEFKIIADLLEENTRILDVGCDDGTLMEFLKKNKNVDIVLGPQSYHLLPKMIDAYKKNKEKKIKNLIGYNSKIKYEMSNYKKIIANTEKLSILNCTNLILKKIL